MSGVVRKKPDDKYLTALRELVNTGGGNRQCFDCGQKGPTYVNMTIGSFVCTRCSGVLRGLTPPHRVKSISMATFTQEEIDFLKAHGNDACAKTWLGLWDPKRAVHQDHRELMIDKYERKRYYLEPASPLKSLTNAASLKSTPSQSTGQTNNGNQTTALSSNGHKPLNGSSSGSGTLDNGFHSIQLTPPTSQRNTSNSGMQHKSSSSAISRPHLQQNGHHHQDAFMLSNKNNNNINNNNNSNHNGNGFNHHHHHHHGFNASAGSTSTGALSDTSSCASNGFGPEADFVADFGSANIFDATSASSVGSPAVSSASSVASTNGYAKIQPIKAAHHHQQHHQFVNGHANGQLNGTGSAVNGNTTENFADFDHAPIYNAAGAIPIPNVNHKGSLTASTNNNNNKLSSTPSEDRYAALKDLDEQLRESKAVSAASAPTGGANILDSFGNNNNNLSIPNGGSVNPFKSQQQNPFQMATANNNNNNSNNNNNNVQHLQQQNLYGQLTVIPNGMLSGSAPTSNGFGVQQTPPQPTAFFNYSNGFTSASLQGGVLSTGQTAYHPTMASGPSGCGFGFGTMQQQMVATGVGTVNGGVGSVGAYVNPFAAAGATNNPFL